ncbi:MAG: hypothetical protein KatS3mg032_2465 [Cyclobacteriaceae bacterium]|nr:MAG: hypothetical protein KatS3mg032_2465 [Cyclobacteriaceae bacterium]
MKKIIVLMVLAGFSCSDEPSQQVREDLTAIPEDLGGILLGSFVAPAGTRAVLSDNGRKLTYTLPEGYVYAGIGKNGNLETFTSGCYQCTSSCSSGCDVIRLGDQIGCSACDPNSTGSKVCSGSPCDVQYAVEHGGLVNTKAGISFVSSADELKSLRNDLPTWQVLEKMEEVQLALNKFIDEVWDNNLNPQSGKWVVVNFFGAAAKMLVPANYTAARTLNAQGTSCNCVQGSGCSYEAIYRMGIKVGEICRSGGCNQCQMIYE